MVDQKVIEVVVDDKEVVGGKSLIRGTEKKRDQFCFLVQQTIY